MKIKKYSFYYSVYLIAVWFIGLSFFFINCHIPFIIVFLFISLLCTWLIVKGKSFFNFFELQKTDIQWNDLIFIGLILLFSNKLVIPDSNFDCLNYHIFSIENPFENSIYHNVFPSGLHSFIGGYSDLLFYLPHTFLGYRMGVIVNTLVLIIIFFQIRDLLLVLVQKTKKDAISLSQKKVISLFSFLIISTEGILSNLCIYKNDLLFFPILLELLTILLTNEKKNYTYIIVLSAFSVLIKLTSIIFVLPIIASIYFSDPHKENIFNLIGKVFLTFAVVLSFEYLSKYQQCGNPFFPFYNIFFKSEYFPEYNFFDLRWGPKSFFEKLIWPLKIFINQERFSEIHYYSGRISLIFLFLPLAIYQWLKNRNKAILYMWLILTASLFLWILSTGYSRYALFIEILAGICFFYLILNHNLNKLVKSLYLLIILIQVSIAFYYYIGKNMDWSWRESLLSNPKLYVKNCRMLLRDTPITNENKYSCSATEAWITIHKSAYCSMLDNSKPICDITFYKSCESNQKNNVYQSFFNTYSNKVLSMPVDVYSFESTISRINKLGLNKFHISSIETVFPTFMKKDEPLFIFEFDDINIDNELINFKSNQNRYEFKVDSIISDTIVFEAIIGYNPVTYNWNVDGFVVNVTFKENGISRTIFEKSIEPNNKFHKIVIEQPIDPSQKELDIEISMKNNIGKNWDGDWISIINPRYYNK